MSGVEGRSLSGVEGWSLSGVEGKGSHCSPGRTNPNFLCWIIAWTGIWAGAVLPSIVHAETLSQLASQVLAQHPGYETARLQQALAVEQKRQTLGALLPSVDLSLIANDSRHSTDYDKAELTMMQPLLHLSAWHQNEQQAIAVDKARLDVTLTTNQLLLEVARQFTDGVLAQERLQLQDQQEGKLRLLYQQAKRQWELGQGLQLDMNQAKANWDKLLAEKRLTEIRYQQVLRWFSLHTQQEVTALDDGDRLMAQHPKSPSLAANEKAWNVKLQQAVFDQSMALRQVSVQRAAYWPTVNLVAKALKQDNHATANSAFNTTEDVNVSIEMNWNLFAGLASDGAVEEAANIQYRQAVLNVRLQAVDGALQRHELQGTMLANVEKIQSLQASLASDEALADKHHRQWQVGAVSFHQVVESNADVYETRYQLIELRQQNWQTYWQWLSLTKGLELSDLD